MRILIVWSGALVPAYRQFFLELARYARVRALGPRRWTHGSVKLGPEESAPQENMEGCEILPALFWPQGSPRYLVPSLPLHLWAYRPRYLYIMDEMDRLSLAVHALAARLAWPPVKVICYSLQNLPRPGYYRWHHRLALRLNRLLVSRAVAASREAADVLDTHGFRGPKEVIPLWGSESFFTPIAPGRPGAAGEAAQAAQARKSLGLPEGVVVILYAGGLVEAKGLSLLAEALPRFPHLRLVTAGQGPLRDSLRARLGPQWTHLGALQAGELRRFYRLGQYVILPSLTTPDWKEQVGRSLIEGILSGCIALGSDSGHIPELTLFPETTFRQGDSASLAALLASLPLPGADAIRDAQRRNVEARFTSAATAKKTWGFLSGAAA